MSISKKAAKKGKREKGGFKMERVGSEGKRKGHGGRAIGTHRKRGADLAEKKQGEKEIFTEKVAPHTGGRGAYKTPLGEGGKWGDIRHQKRPKEKKKGSGSGIHPSIGQGGRGNHKHP